MLIDSGFGEWRQHAGQRSPAKGEQQPGTGKQDNVSGSYPSNSKNG
jgi:hypothetical protein